MLTPQILLALALGTSAMGAHSQQHGHTGHAQSAARPAPASPYADESQREIKALSADEQRAWLEGQGVGLARAAELNRHPGPMHVLELARPLALSAEHERRTRALMDRHKAEVRDLGERLVALERELDRLFAGGMPVKEIESSRLAESIGTLAGRIRASHLRTHIHQTARLSPEQVERYHQLRGYAR